MWVHNLLTYLCKAVMIVNCGRLFDSVVGNLAKNFAEGTEYFKVNHCTHNMPQTTRIMIFVMCVREGPLNIYTYIHNVVTAHTLARFQND